MIGRLVCSLSLLLAVTASASAQSVIYEACAPSDDYQFFGLDVASLGDVDADGRGDLAVTASGFQGQPTAVFVLSGKHGEWIYELPGSGRAVAGPGDATGDGVPDIAALDFSVGGAGGLRLFSGANGSLVMHAPYTGYSMGVEPLQPAGDVDGDGLGDLLLHAEPMYGHGEARLVSGTDGAVLWSHETYPEFAIAALGDQDGDGITEVAYVERTDLLVDPYVIYTVHVVSPGSGAELFVWESDPYVGATPVAAGDVDGDGVPDLAVDGPLETNVWSGADGSLIRTIADVSYTTRGVGDVNADGFADIAYFGEPATPGLGASWYGLHVVLGPDAEPLHVFEDEVSGFAFWSFDFSGVGDIDGDGRGDLVVTIPNTTTGLAPPGCVQSLGFGPAELFGVGPDALSLGETAIDVPLTITGQSFQGITAMEFDGRLLPVPGPDVDVLGPNELVFDPPPAAGLETVEVKAINGSGPSNALSISLTETHPPLLLAPELVLVGDDIEWSLYGGAHDAALLLVSMKQDTFVVGGWTLLRAYVVLNAQMLDGNGLGGLSVKLPASVPLPLYLWSQVAIVEHGHLVEASAIVKTLLAETD